MRDIQVSGWTKRRKAKGHQYKRVQDKKAQVKRARYKRSGSKKSNLGATLRAMLVLLLID